MSLRKTGLRTMLWRAINEYAEASVALSWKGSEAPEDFTAITGAYNKARDRLRKLMLEVPNERTLPVRPRKNKGQHVPGHVQGVQTEQHRAVDSSASADPAVRQEEGAGASSTEG